jgi:signal transduction histidine kinase
MLIGTALLASLLGALLVYVLLMQRLRSLIRAVIGFREGDLARPLSLPGANAAGDGIDRLGAAVQGMSERMVRQVEQLHHAQALRLELLANISHDLRTPLASMQGYLEILLLKHATMPPEEQLSYLEIATRHSERLGRLISDLFQLSKLEAHELTPQLEPFSVAELVQDLVQKFRLAAEKRGLKLDSVLSGQQFQVDGDIAMIETVLENLIENAMRNTPRDGRIRVEVEPCDGRVAVRVADTGCGIAQEDLTRIFERYFHQDRSTAGEPGGTGLGLAIVRRIVELHGGAMSVESTPGQGTVFGFDLQAASDTAPRSSIFAAVSATRN